MPDVPNLLMDTLADKDFWRTTFAMTGELYLMPALLVWRMGAGALGEVMRVGR